MRKVIFFFAGTGDDGRGYAVLKEKQCSFQDEVIRIYIKGCQEERVGNGFLFPDLQIAANNIREAFTGKKLNFNILRSKFGRGLYAIRGKNVQSEVEVADITLEGFSRGAVTTFATAKKLDDLNIPIHIIANQPVPGESGIAKGLYSQYCDLTHCLNIKSAHTFLASYDLEQGLVSNYFFRQMIAKFPLSANAKEILLPHRGHLDWFKSSPIPYYINKLMAENGLTYSKNDEASIKKWYLEHKESYFTPQEFMQTIYGAEGSVSKDPVYLKLEAEDAKKILAQNKVSLADPLNSEQAAAIKAISCLEFDCEEKRMGFYKLILENSKRAEQFVKIINKVTEVCDYLSQVTKDNTSNKSELIKRHASAYQESVFNASFQLLSTNGVPDKLSFVDRIYAAERTFRNQALGVERNLMRTVLKLLTNFITHITGIAIIVNSINKIRTGNWLLFQHNRSAGTVREMRKELEELLSDQDSSVNNFNRSRGRGL